MTDAALPSPLSIAALRFYPIKGCRAVEADEARIGAFGLHWDREWMVVDAVTGVFLSQRQHPVMARIAPRIEGEELVVTSPGVREPLRVPAASPARVVPSTASSSLTCCASCGASSAPAPPLWPSALLALPRLRS